MNPPPATLRPNWILRNRWWFVPSAILGTVLLFGAVIVGLVLLTGISLKKTDVFHQALEKARNHPQVIEALGTPIEPGWYISGTLADVNGRTAGDLVVLLRGPRGRGMLHAVAYGGGFEDLTLDVKATGMRIFLQWDLPPHDLKLVKRLDRAMADMNDGKTAKAREQIKALTEQFPGQPLVYLRSASLALAEEDFATAIDEAGQVIKQHSRFSTAYHLRAEAAQRAGDLKTALADYTTLTELEPDEPWNFNNQAWLLCTAEDPDIRDGATAVKRAEQAAEMSGRKFPGILDTLACAYAEAGDFDKAITIQQEALVLEQPAAQKTELQERLALFREKKPYRIAKY